jgi:inorganic triphosphatase YgiF
MAPEPKALLQRAMTETELKLWLEEGELARLQKHPALPGLRLAPPRTQTLVSVYYDTADHALAAAGVALRLRRVGRRWLQTIKRRGDGTASNGLFSHLETEVAAPGGRLVLAGPDPEGAIAAVRDAAGDRALAPVFETRVRRVVERIAAPGGGEVELALDRGEVRAGEAHAAIREAELELVSGEVGAVYAVARPTRFLSSKRPQKVTCSIGNIIPP